MKSKMLVQRMKKMTDAEADEFEYDEKPKLFATISAEKEVDLIVEFLSRRWKMPFKKRIGLDGYLDEPEYSLDVISNSDAFGSKYIHAFGRRTKNIFEVNEFFLKHYWENQKLRVDVEAGKASYDSEYEQERCEDTSIQMSRARMFLKAQIEGLI